MSRPNWHIQSDETSLTLSRRAPARFDVFSETRLPAGRKLRLAHQVRQDLWRALQDLRGFTPVIEVRDTEDGLTVKAGGQFCGVFPKASTEARIADVLADPKKRDRWNRFARFKQDRKNA